MPESRRLPARQIKMRRAFASFLRRAWKLTWCGIGRGSCEARDRSFPTNALHLTHLSWESAAALALCKHMVHSRTRTSNCHLPCHLGVLRPNPLGSTRHQMPRSMSLKLQFSPNPKPGIRVSSIHGCNAPPCFPRSGTKHPKYDRPRITFWLNSQELPCEA
jgi:hypothetical protein